MVAEELRVVSNHTAQAATGLAEETATSDLDSLRRPDHGATIPEARAPLPRIGWRVDGTARHCTMRHRLRHHHRRSRWRIGVEGRRCQPTCHLAIRTERPGRISVKDLDLCAAAAAEGHDAVPGFVGLSRLLITLVLVICGGLHALVV